MSNPHIHFDPALIDKYNQGYGAGYHRNKKPLQKISVEMEGYSLFMRGYLQGIEDRAEDEEAIASGEFDLLNEEERRYLYGDEVDHV